MGRLPGEERPQKFSCHLNLMGREPTMPSPHPHRTLSLILKEPGCWLMTTVNVLYSPSQSTRHFPIQCFVWSSESHSGGGRVGRLCRIEALESEASSVLALSLSSSLFYR